MGALFHINKNFLENLFIRSIVIILGIFSIALCCAVLDAYTFFQAALPALCLLAAVYSIAVIVVNRKAIQFKNYRIDYLTICFILLICTISSFYFSEYLIEGGHDQGGYLESGILLAKTGSLWLDPAETPFAYAVPGFFPYENGLLRHHFVPGNAVFLSIFYSLFGISGIKVANCFILFFSTSLIYFLLKRVKNWKIGVLWVIFFLLNYYTLYFSRSTFVENLQLLFTWFYVYSFVRGFQKKQFGWIVFSLVPLVLLMTVRLEAFLYIIVYCLIVIVFLFRKTVKINFRHWWKYLLPVLFGVAVLLSLLEFDPSFLDPALSFIKDNQVEASLAWGPAEYVPYNQQVFIFASMFYMFTPVFVMIFFLGVVNFFQEERVVKQKLMLVFFLILPQFAFLLRPGIAFYLPWFVRRYWAVFFTFAFILFACFLVNKSGLLHRASRKIFITITVLLFIIISLPGITMLLSANGGGMLEYEEKIASHFTENDVVFFWDRYRYENFGPPLFFLYDTNVAFDRIPAFGKEIYASIMKEYDNVYLASTKELTGDSIHPYFDGHLEFVEKMTSSIMKIAGSTCDLRKYLTTPSLFRSYAQFEGDCTKNNPPLPSSTAQISLNLYRVEGQFVQEFISQYYDENLTVDSKTKNIWH
ncbi:MAG: hypothetical protein WC505_03190 [Patescibacteria group bacterium]